MGVFENTLHKGEVTQADEVGGVEDTHTRTHTVSVV